MAQSQFAVSWDSYKSSICNGFSILQQNGELVDMTLAADGHFVKVHQILIALASPYLKELITSAPCQHPIIFLNNVSHKTLCLLLEYIYTGEVIIPAENLSSFIETAKTLHIKGLESMASSDNLVYKMRGSTSQTESVMKASTHLPTFKRMALHAREGTGQISLPAAATKVYLKHESKLDKSHMSLKQASDKSLASQDTIHDYSDMDDSFGQEFDDDRVNDSQTSVLGNGNTAVTSEDKSTATNLQFTVSIRGSLQVILNRFIYNLHSTTHRTGLRRWRCVDYRNNKCMAFLITKGNIVLNRANPHNHSFHDKKILAKIQKKAVFSALDDVEGYKQKEFGKDTDNNSTVEQDEYLSLDFSGNLSDISDSTRPTETIVKHTP